MPCKLNAAIHSLQVAGLAEGRPSVLVGDFILVKHQDSESTPWFKGCVHEIFVDYVSLRFSSTFSTYKGTKFDVRFVLNRLPLRRMHQVLTLKVDSSRLIFPEPEHINSMLISNDQLDAITPRNRIIGADHEQLLAVASIVNLPPGSAPFVIFGPSVLCHLSYRNAVTNTPSFEFFSYAGLELARLSLSSKPFFSYWIVIQIRLYLHALQATLQQT